VYEFQPGEFSLVIPNELLRQHFVRPGILSEFGVRFLMSVVHPKDSRPLPKRDNVPMSDGNFRDNIQTSDIKPIS
jgi:hypothetical protein